LGVPHSQKLVVQSHSSPLALKAAILGDVIEMEAANPEMTVGQYLSARQALGRDRSSGRLDDDVLKLPLSQVTSNIRRNLGQAVFEQRLQVDPSKSVSRYCGAIDQTGKRRGRSDTKNKGKLDLQQAIVLASQKASPGKSKI
jgi:hypothetical protein